MKKFYHLLIVFLLATFYTSNAQVYKYDFNPFTKIARIYTNSEIILDFDVLFNDGSSKDLKFENGYIFESENGEWIEKGFYNKNEIIYNKTTYPLKTNLIGKVLIKNETDKKWLKIKTNGNQITLDKNFDQFPKPVQYLILQNNVRNLCLTELKILENQLNKSEQTEN